MRTHGCRWTVVALLILPALFLLVACGSSSTGDNHPSGTVPYVSSTSPTSVSAGASGLTLTVVGFNFLSGAVVRWNDSSLATTYVSATQLTATVPANRIAASAYVTIRVVNPGSGGMSLPITFTVNNPAPLVTGIAGDKN